MLGEERRDGLDHVGHRPCGFGAGLGDLLDERVVELDHLLEDFLVVLESESPEGVTVRRSQSSRDETENERSSL